MSSNNSINILLVGPIPPDYGGEKAGGVATHIWQLAENCTLNGYNVYILSNLKRIIYHNGITVIPDKSKLNKIVKLIYVLRYYIKNRVSFKIKSFINFTILYHSCILDELIKKYHIDVIHFHSLWNKTQIGLEYLKNKVPSVTTDHGFWQASYHGINNFSIIKINIKNIKGIIGVSNYCIEKQDEYGISKKYSTVIHNPIDVNRIKYINKTNAKKHINLNTNKKIIFFSGVFEPIERKGLDILLNSFSNEKISKICKLLIVTNRESIKFAEMRVKERYIDALILPPQQYETIEKFYYATDVFVMPSRSESFGIVYIESLLAGVPIIGFYKLINEFKQKINEYIGEPFNPFKETSDDLAEKILTVLNKDIEREKLREETIKAFSWENNFYKYEKLYKSLLVKNMEKYS